MSIDLEDEYGHLEPETPGFEQRIAEHIGSAYADNALETLAEARCMHMRRHLVRAMLEQLEIIPDLSNAQISYRIDADADETPVRGNALDSGDDAADREAEDTILERLERGDVWAWCNVRVTAYCTFNDQPYSGRSAWIGGCSYENERDYVQSDTYYTSQQAEALADLRAQIAQATIADMLSEVAS